MIELTLVTLLETMSVTSANINQQKMVLINLCYLPTVMQVKSMV